MTIHEQFEPDGDRGDIVIPGFGIAYVIMITILALIASVLI